MEKNKKQLFGSRIKDLREEIGLTEEQTAKLTGTDIVRLLAIENSEVVDLELTEVLLFAKLFKKDVETLIAGTEQEELTCLCEKQGKKPTKAQMREIKANYSK